MTAGYRQGAEQWAIEVRNTLVEYLIRLGISGEPGRYRPCLEGCTSWGEKAALGFSCFGLKIIFTLGLWEKISFEERTRWTAFIRSFQLPEQAGPLGGVFVDPTVDEYLRRHQTLRRRLHEMRHPLTPGQLHRTRIAETKQAIITLAQVGERPLLSFRRMPTAPKQIIRYLRHFDWRQPWGAGAQFANLAALLSTEGPFFLDAADLKDAKAACVQFIDGLANKISGGYFIDDLPEHGMLVNGAMKVLTGLHWLDCPIHYPERLIDVCLGHLPHPDGCHLVDAVYVLYRCSGQISYRKNDVQTYASNVLEMIKRHRNFDGGFSFNIGKSQTSYYGIPISIGKAESDIHGTALLSWAVAMILELLEVNSSGFRVINP